MNFIDDHFGSFFNTHIRVYVCIKTYVYTYGCTYVHVFDVGSAAP